MLRTSSGAARPAGRGAPGQLGWCQGSDSTPPNSRAGAASELCPPGFNTFSAAPSHSSTAASPLALLWSGQEGGQRRNEPTSRGTQNHPNAAKTFWFRLTATLVAAGRVLRAARVPASLLLRL